MLSSALHLLLVLLPVVLAVRALVRPRPEALEVAGGVMRFCLGFGKGVLLAHPLLHLSQMIWCGAAEHWTSGAAWIGLLAALLGLHFALTGAVDALSGMLRILGFWTEGGIQGALRRRSLALTSGRFWRPLPFVLLATLGLLLLAAGPEGGLDYVKRLFAQAPPTAVAVLQEARVWSDFHLITLVAGLACYLAVPHARDLLRTPARWKAVLCLCVFALALALFWTRVSPA